MKEKIQKLTQLVSFRALLIAVLAVTAILQFALMLDNVRGVTYDIELTELSPDTIRSAKTIEDIARTEIEKDHAEEAVDPVYVIKEDIPSHRATFVTTIFDIVLEVKRKLIQRISSSHQISKSIYCARS